MQTPDLKPLLAMVFAGFSATLGQIIRFLKSHLFRWPPTGRLRDLDSKGQTVYMIEARKQG